MVCKETFRLQTMIAFNKKLLQGVQGDGFLEKSPPGRRRLFLSEFFSDRNQAEEFGAVTVFVFS
jgi:hypothetical protein